MAIFKGTRTIKDDLLYIPRNCLFYIGNHHSDYDRGRTGGEIYGIKFLINLGKAIKKGVTNVKVTAYYEHPDRWRKGKRPYKSSPKLKALALKQSVPRKDRRSYDRLLTVVGAEIIDVTHLINNEVASSIDKYPLSTKIFNERILPRKDVFQVIPSNVDRRIGLSAATTMTAIPIGFPTRGTDEITNSHRYIIMLQQGHDPASILKYPFPLIPPQLRMQNTHGYSKSSGYSFLAPPMRRLGTGAVDLNVDLAFFYHDDHYSDSTMEMQAVRLATINSAEGKVGESIIKQSLTLEWHRVEAEFKFSRPLHLALSSMIYFEFLTIDARGNTRDRHVLPIQISDSLKLASYPVTAPTIMAKWSNEGNLITVLQTDYRAYSVVVYAKQIDMPTLISGGYPGWSRLKELYASNTRSATYVHRVINNGPTIYRAFAISSNGKISHEFSSVVVWPTTFEVSGVRSFPVQKIQDISNAILIPKRVGPAVQIEVTNILGIDITKIAIQVTNVTCSTSDIGTPYRRVNVLTMDGENGGPIGLSTTKQNSVFYHSTPEDNNAYQYTAVFQKSDGTISQGGYRAYFEYLGRTKYDEGVRISTGPAVMTNTGPRFKILMGFNEPGFSDVLTTLAAGGISTPFLDEIRSNRGRVESLLKAHVIRYDKTTGGTTDYGLVEAGEFLDSANVVRGHEYLYEVRLLRASIFDLIRGITLDEKDALTLRNYAKDRAKFENSTTLRTNTLPAVNALTIKNDPDTLKIKEVFWKGRTSHVSYVELSVPVMDVSIEKLVAIFSEDTEIGPSVTVSGFIHGAVKMVDSVIIYAETSRQKAVVGVVHMHGNDRGFTFRDTTLGSVVGTRKYSARILKNNYAMSSETPQYTITKRTSLSFDEERANGI